MSYFEIIFFVYMWSILINIIYIPLYIITLTYYLVRYRNKKNGVKHSIKKSLPYFVGGFVITVIVGITEPRTYDVGEGFYTHLTAFLFIVIIPTIIFIKSLISYKKSK